MSGWIKLHRSLFDHPLSRDPVALALWVRLITLANYEPTTVRWGKDVRTLERGQVLITLRETAEQSGLTVKQIRRALEVLEKGTHVGTHKGTHGTIVTIVNYEQYQETKKTKGTHKGTHKGTQRAHHKPKNETQSLEPQGVDSIIGNDRVIKEVKEFLEEADDQKIFSLRREAEETLALAIDFKAGYTDHKAVRATAKAALDKYGIDVIRRFGELVIEGDHVGQIPFSQRHILILMQEAKQSLANCV